MYTLVIVIHVIACFILIAAILFQAGRGGGLSELFGGGTSQTIFGTRASTFLTRATTVAAIVFLLTCVSLTIFSSRKVKSLMTGVQEAQVMQIPTVEVSEQTEVQQEGSGQSQREPETSPE